MKQIKVELLEWMGDDKAICQSAWTSSSSYEDKKTRTKTDIKRLVNFLADHKHGTPFEAVVMRFWIKLPIQTDRQHMTHRIASHNGMSGRYRTMPNEWMKLPDDVKAIVSKMPMAEDIEGEYEALCKRANDWYQEVLGVYKMARDIKHMSPEEFKRVREFFRGVLPQNNMTERVTIFNLRSFANYLKQRNSEHAQPEIREIAQLMLKEVKKKKVCPIALAALEKNKWEI